MTDPKAIAEELVADARREAGKWGPGPTATGLLLHRLADTIDALVKERDEALQQRSGIVKVNTSLKQRIRSTEQEESKK